MKIEALVELVRTTVESVQQLSALIEGVPRAVDAKLAVIQQAMAADAATVRAEVKALRTEFSDLQAEAGALHGAFNLHMAAVRTDFDQIIADNRAEFGVTVQSLTNRVERMDTTVDSRLRSVNESMHGLSNAAAESVRKLHETITSEVARVEIYAKEQIADVLLRFIDVERDVTILQVQAESDHAVLGVLEVHSTGIAEKITAAVQVVSTEVARVDTEHAQRIEQVRGEIGEASTALHKVIGETRTACDTADLHHGLALTKTALESLREAHMVVATQVGDLVGGTTLRFTGVESFTKDLATMISVNETATIELYRPLVKRLDDVDPALATLGLSVQAAHEGLEAANLRITAVDESLRTVVAETFGPLNERLNVLGGSTQQLGEGLTAESMKMQGEFAEYIERATTAHAALVDSVTIVDRDLRFLVSDTKTALEGAVQQVGEDLRGVNAVVRKSVTDFANHEEGHLLLNATIGRVEQGTAEVALDLVTRVSTLGVTTQAHTERIAELAECTATMTLAQQAMPTREETQQALEKASQAVDARVTEATVGVRLAVDEQITLLRTMHDELNGRVENLPVPPAFDPLPIKAELLAWLGDRLVESTQNIEVPQPEFDLQFNDQTLVVSLTVGDKTITRATTLGLGIVYRGVYSRDEDYKTGNFVTHKGSVWFAKSKPTGEPGKDLTAWQLAVKCGRDGKDAIATRAYTGHDGARVYRETDFLRLNNRLWQCCAKETNIVPEPGDISSTHQWTLIGGIQ